VVVVVIVVIAAATVTVMLVVICGCIDAGSCLCCVQRMQKMGHEYHNIHYSDALSNLTKAASPLPSLYGGSSTSLQSVGVRSSLVSQGSVSTVPPVPVR